MNTTTTNPTGTRARSASILRGLASGAALAALAASASAQPAGAPNPAGQDDAARAAAPVDPDLLNQGAAPNTRIDRDTVKQLGLAWKIETDSPVSHSALVDEGVLFFADWGGHVYKANAETGEVIWKKKIAEPQTSWPWHGFAGTGALTDELFVVASVEGMAYGVDRETGEVRWETEITEDEQGGSLAKILHHDGRVFLGLQSVEEPMTMMQQDFNPDFQGGVLALDASTGEKVWEVRTVDPPATGCAVWSSFALDPRLGYLYFTTGNNYTAEDEATELSDAVVAVRADTGDLVWARQTFEHDIWTPAQPLGPDYDFGGGPQLFDVTIHGQPRHAVLAAQKSGLLWAFDRVTGERLWATNIGYGGVDGGMHGEVSIGDGYVIAWSNNGYHHTRPPSDGHMTVKRLDAASGRPVWVKETSQPAGLWCASVLANDVFFVGSADGTVQAYDVEDGEVLWKANDGSLVSHALVIDADTLFVPSCRAGFLPRWIQDTGPSGMFAYSLDAGRTTVEQPTGGDGSR